MTKKQLLDCFQDYRNVFPDWSVEHDVVLTRRSGPIEQHISFEILRAHAYRPQCGITVLTAPRVRLLADFLDIKHQQIDPRRHGDKWRDVVKAMEAQFRPSIRKPLDVAEVVKLAERDVAERKAGNVRYCAGLASLNAYLGNRDRALYWCHNIDDQFAAMARELAPWEREIRDLVKRIRDIETGNAGSLFEQA